MTGDALVWIHDLHLTTHWTCHRLASDWQTACGVGVMEWYSGTPPAGRGTPCRRCLPNAARVVPFIRLRHARRKRA